MAAKKIISRSFLIIKKLRKHPATFEEIERYLARESELQDYNYTVSTRTFNRDVKAVGDIFDIYIKYNRSNGKYYIDEDLQPEATERVLEAYDTFQALNLTERLSDHIHFEKRRPKGTEHLYGLLQSIKKRVIIEFTYQNFWEEQCSQRSAEPYALKEFKNRWYVIAKDQKDQQVKSFALDRLDTLVITRKHFQFPADFDVSDHFRYSFGIISPGGEEPQDIILSFDPHQGKYIKTLPLHDTQQILLDNGEELQISLKLCITYDFIMELLSFGDSMKVIQPFALVEQIKAAHGDALKQY